MWKVLVLALVTIAIVVVALYVQTSTFRGLSLRVVDANTYLTMNGRGFKLLVVNDGGMDVELSYITINRSKVFTWSPDKEVLKPGEKAVVDVFFYWIKGVKYVITVTGMGKGQYVNSSTTVNTPVFSSKLEISITGVHAERIDSGLTRINITYLLESVGYSNVNIRVFTCRSYTNTSIPIYVFYDYRYMPRNTLNLIDKLVGEASKHGVNISRASWERLEELVEDRSRCILILMYPLSSTNIPLLNAALPACIVDPNRSGGIADNSRYGKSLVYDWMRDNGLILVTVGSSASQPNTWILYGDGYAGRNLDKSAYEDSCIQLTDANIIIMSGSGGCGVYMGSKISETLGLHVWNGDWGFDIDGMIRENIRFYSYANWRLKTPKGVFNLSMPCFVRVGSGGWLSLDNRFLPLPAEAVVNDLVAILKHSPWSMDWYPYGWMYDNGYVNESGQNITKTGKISLTIPHGVKGEIMVVAAGYDRDNDSYKYITIYEEWKLE